MKIWTLLGGLVLLQGCATQDAVIPDSAPVATLTPLTMGAHVMVVRLNDQVYSGEWTGGRCFTDACRGPYRNLLRHDRRHVSKGGAVLASPAHDQLRCEWVRYRDEMQGTCRAQDGREYSLISA